MPKRHQTKRYGHPARQAAHRTRGQRRGDWFTPDARELEIRELNREMRQAIHQQADDIDPIAGPLAVAARHATPTILADFDLDADEHAIALEHWLTHRLGQALKHPDIDGYLAWRQDRQEAASALD